jgi:hypothetical protein
MLNFSNAVSVIIELKLILHKIFRSLMSKFITSRMDPKWQFQCNVIVGECTHCGPHYTLCAVCSTIKNLFTLNTHLTFQFLC